MWETFEHNSGADCGSKRIWLGITNVQNQSEFWNTSRFTHRDIFIDHEIVGQKLTEERWGLNQPSGSVVENCVATSRLGKWHDLFCDSTQCTGCLMDLNRQFKLRGFCEHTNFETRFKISGEPDNETGDLYFIGQFGWQLRRKKDKNGNITMGYGLYQPGKNNPLAVYNDTNDYPMGYKKWVVKGGWDNCPTREKYNLSFSR